MQQYALPHETWRELTRRWRLKTAVLWLSSDDCTVTDVSQLAGYKMPRSMNLAGTIPRNSNGKVLKREIRARIEAERHPR